MTVRSPLVVIGAGGHAKVCIEAIRAQGCFEPVACLDGAAKVAELLGVPVKGGDELLHRLLAEGVRHAFLAIGSNTVRQRLAHHVLSLGFELPSAIDPTALISPTARVGAGVLVMPGVIVNAEAQIGNFVILNTAAVIEHDCRIGSAAHVAPGSVLTGNVCIGDCAFVGARAVVRPGIRIGCDATIGAGAAVVCDVPDNAIYAGVPARPLSSRT